MARAGMATLIAEVRRLANAGTADYTIDGTTYWSDDQIEAALDRQQQVYKRVRLIEAPDYIDGEYVYTEYFIPPKVGKRVETGDNFVVRDTEGDAAPSYTLDANALKVTFAVDTGGTVAYFADLRTYDVYAATADVYESKAGHSAESSFDWSSDNHSVKASQKYSNYLKMAERFRQMSRGSVRTVRRVRRDEI